MQDSKNNCCRIVFKAFANFLSSEGTLLQGWFSSCVFLRKISFSHCVLGQQESKV